MTIVQRKDKIRDFLLKDLHLNHGTQGGRNPLLLQNNWNKKKIFNFFHKKVTALKSQLSELSSSFCDHETFIIELDEKIVSFHACSLWDLTEFFLNLVLVAAYWSPSKDSSSKVWRVSAFEAVCVLHIKYELQMDDGVLHMKYKYSGDTKRNLDQLPRLAVPLFFKLWMIFSSNICRKKSIANVHMKSGNIKYGVKPTHHTVVLQ